MTLIRRPGLNSRRSAAWLGGLAAGVCAVVVLGSVGFVGGHGAATVAMLAVWLPLLPLVAAASLFLPWERLPRSALLVYPLALVLALDLTGRLAPTVGAAYAPMFVVLFAYVGLTQRRLTSVLLVGPAAVGWLGTASGRDGGHDVIRLLVTAVVWVLVAELLAWRTTEQTRVRGLLAESAGRDPLTGLANRRGLPAALAATDQETAVVMLDLDHFKALNDDRGHLEGDRVLADFGAVLGAVLRRGDRAFRYGGEEFLILAPGSGLAGAERMLERVRDGWSVLRPDVTFSAGLAAWSPDESGQEALRRADVALYRAKAAGRSCWRVAEAPPAARV